MKKSISSMRIFTGLALSVVVTALPAYAADYTYGPSYGYQGPGYTPPAAPPAYTPPPTYTPPVYTPPPVTPPPAVTPPPVTPPVVTTPPPVTVIVSTSPPVADTTEVGSLTNAVACSGSQQNMQPGGANGLQNCLVVASAGAGGSAAAGGAPLIDIINNGVKPVPTLNLVVAPGNNNRIALVEAPMPTEQAAYAVPMVEESPPIAQPSVITGEVPIQPPREIRNAVRGYW